MPDRSFFRHALLYGLGAMLMQAGGMLLTPLYTRCLSQADYGAYEVLGRCAELAGTLLLLSGLRQALLTFYQQSKTDMDRRGVFRATMLLLFTVCVSGGALAMALAGPFCAFFAQNGGTTISPGLLRLALLAVLLEPLTLMPLVLLQARLESAAFVVVTVSQLFVRIALCVALTVWLHWGVAGVLTASAATTGAYGGILTLRELLRGGPWPGRARLLALLRFALPFVPGGLCFFILQYGDRFYLLYCRGEVEVGVYGLGYKVALAVATFSVAPLYMVWAARMYKAAEAPDAAREFGRMFTRLVGAFLVVGLAACLFQDEVVAVLGGPAYAGAAGIVAPVVLAGLFQSAAALMDAGFYVRRRTSLKLYLSLAASAVTLVLYALLIPPYGAAGAAAATVVGFAFLAICTWRVSQGVFRVEYEWGRLIDLAGLAAGLWLASRFLPEAGWAVAVKAVMWLSWPLLVWTCGVPSDEERAYVYALIRIARELLRRESVTASGERQPPDSSPVPIPYSKAGGLRPPLARYTHEAPRMDTTFLGGVLNRPAAPAAAGEGWRVAGPAGEMFLRADAPGCRLLTWDSLAILVRGYARPPGQSGPPDAEGVAEALRCHYLEHGNLAVDGLEGSFTVALLDGQARRALLYRNLVGAGFTYYHAGPTGLIFGGNLAELVAASGEPRRPNRDVLPLFFLYRSTPGADTLFEGFHRLLPGEQLTWDERGLTRVQRTTFADLREPTPAGDPAERLRETMSAILADCAALQPGAANLLSGGVDSSYVQAVWNRVAPIGDGLPPSYSIMVDHPRTWLDTDYAVTAAQALGAGHTLIPADGLYSEYLVETLAATGEPPNHVQSAYFLMLARAMAGHGAPAGLCGEGADSLFGVGLADAVHEADFVRRRLPLRAVVAAVFRALGWGRWADACRLADRLSDFDDLENPVNRVASFADWDKAEACFGAAAVAGAAAGRRGLLDRLAVPATPLDRLHSAGFLGEAVDSASLWTTLFNHAGTDLFCPFLDSRMLRFALNLPPSVRYRFRRPKDLLKRALERLAPAELARRRKLGFGQPIFEWLAPGGQLRPLVDAIGEHDFVPPAVLARAKAAPGWFLYSLLCYDVWHKLFIERSLAFPEWAERRRDQAALARAG